MNRRRVLSIFACTVGAAAFLPPRAAAASIDEVLAELTRARASLKTFTAHFTQVRTIGLLASDVESKGELTLVRPDRLRWELFAPDSVTYWVGPEGFSVSTGNSTKSVGKNGAGRFGLVLADLLIFLGGDLKRLLERYELSVPTQAPITIVAIPKTKDVAKFVARMEMTFGTALWDVTSITIEEANGDKSVIRLEAAKRDLEVPDSKMRPSPSR